MQDHFYSLRFIVWSSLNCPMITALLLLFTQAARPILKRNFSAEKVCWWCERPPPVGAALRVCVLREHVRLRSGDMDIRPYGRLKEGMLSWNNLWFVWLRCWDRNALSQSWVRSHALCTEMCFLPPHLKQWNKFGSGHVWIRICVEITVLEWIVLYIMLMFIKLKIIK